MLHGSLFRIKEEEKEPQGDDNTNKQYRIESNGVGLARNTVKRKRDKVQSLGKKSKLPSTSRSL